MPTYEYRCKACSHQFDVVHRVADPAPTSCPACGEGPIQKIFTSVGIIFKGSGFHVNDYSKAGSKSEPKPDAAAPTGDSAESPTSGETPADKSSEKPADKSSDKPADSGPAAPAANSPESKPVTPSASGSGADSKK